MPSMDFYENIRKEVSDLVPASKFISLRDFSRRFAMAMSDHVELIRSGELKGVPAGAESAIQKCFGYMIFAIEPCCHHVENEEADIIETIKGLKASRNTAFFLNDDFYFTPVKVIDTLKEIDMHMLVKLDDPKMQGIISVLGGAIFTKALQGIDPITLSELEGRGAVEASWENRTARRVTGSPRDIVMSIAQDVVDQRFPNDADVAERRELDSRFPNIFGI